MLTKYQNSENELKDLANKAKKENKVIFANCQKIPVTFLGHQPGTSFLLVNEVESHSTVTFDKKNII